MPQSKPGSRKGPRSKSEGNVEGGSRGMTTGPSAIERVEVGSVGSERSDRSSAVEGDDAAQHRSVSNEEADALTESAPIAAVPSMLHGDFELEPRGFATEAMEFEQEDETLAEAWYAEFGTPEGLTLAIRSANRGDPVAEDVIDQDDRIQIHDTEAREIPWREICSLRIIAADGSAWKGTGWIVGDRTVITAGHVVYMHSRGGWVRSIEVIPGRTGPDRSGPYGTYTSTRFRSVRGWIGQKNPSNDYGAILLDPRARFDSAIGSFGFASRPDSTLTGLRANVAGYPGDKEAGTLWYHARPISQVLAAAINLHD